MKRFFIGIFFIVLFFCSGFISGCTASINSEMQNSLSEVRFNLFVFSNELINVKFTSGFREDPYVLNGISENKKEFGVITTKFLCETTNKSNLPSFVININNNGWFYRDINNRSSAWTSVEDLWNYGLMQKNIKLKQVTYNEIDIGDIIQFYNETTNKFYHCVIVTAILQPISLKNIFVTSHDNNAYNKSLSLYNVNQFRFGKIN